MGTGTSHASNVSDDQHSRGLQLIPRLSFFRNTHNQHHSEDNKIQQVRQHSTWGLCCGCVLPYTHSRFSPSSSKSSFSALSVSSWTWTSPSEYQPLNMVVQEEQLHGPSVALTTMAVLSPTRHRHDHHVTTTTSTITTTTTTTTTVPPLSPHRFTFRRYTIHRPPFRVD